VQDLRDLAAEDTDSFVDSHFLEISNGCSESCEVTFEEPQLEIDFS
jgi:hypothetical protein